VPPEVRHQRHCVTRPTDLHAPSTAAGWLLSLLDVLGSGPAGSSVRQCPAHRDEAPSLSVGQGPDGRALVYCHAGCTTRDVMSSLQLPMARLFTPATRSPADYAAMFGLSFEFPAVVRSRGGNRGATGYRLEAVHEYGSGKWLLNRWRHPGTGKKELVWETQTERGSIPGLLGVPLSDLPLYQEREVRMAIGAQEPVLLVESESSVDTLRGFFATTWAGGASNPPTDRLARTLAGARVVLIPDNDPPGLACAEKILAALPGAVVLVPDEGQDAGDLYRALGQARLAEQVNALLDDMGAKQP
jgi:putative DNA primase/helicase